MCPFIDVPRHFYAILTSSLASAASLPKLSKIACDAINFSLGFVHMDSNYL